MIRKLCKSAVLGTSALLFHNRKSKIIFYHDVFGDVRYTEMGTPLTLFKEHLTAIEESGFQIATQITEPENQLQICFDDGFRGLWDVRDFFIRHGIRPTVFLAATLVGKPEYLNETEIREMQEQGFIFQGHAWSHSDLTQFTRDELKRELDESRKELSRILNREVSEICFPIGYYSDLVVEACRKYGYTKMYTSIPGNYFDNIGEGLATRNLVQFASPRDLKRILHGGNDLIRSRYRKMHYKR